MTFEGKAFIITGGCGAIGGGVARQIISKGGIALIFDVLDEEKGSVKVKEYHAERALYFKADITDKTQFASACSAAVKAIPNRSLAGGVHCAAAAPWRDWSHKLVDSLEDFAKVTHVNVYGTFLVNACIADAINSQYPDNGPYAPRVAEERGCIVNIASAVARPVPARCITYGPTKTAVLGITAGMADFLGPFGIRVCAVSPGVVASHLLGMERIPYFEAELEAATIFPRRLTTVEEISVAILFLLEHPMMNDFELRVDGGWRGSSNWAGPHDPRSNAPGLE